VQEALGQPGDRGLRGGNQPVSSPDYPVWLVKLAADPLFVTIAAIASLASFAISIAVLYKLTRINAQIVLRARSQPWLGQLRRNASSLARLLPDVENANVPFSKVLAEARPRLSALRICLPVLSAKRRRVRHLVRTIDRYMGQGLIGWTRWMTQERQLAEAIYFELLQVNQTLREDIEQASLDRAQV
jgi:hypothetical protein